MVILFGALLMLIWFAPPLVAINADAVGGDEVELLRLLDNIGAMLIYSLVGIGLSIVATIPFGLGWLVLIPVLWGSWYAGWREMFGEVTDKSRNLLLNIGRKWKPTFARTDSP